MRHGEDRWRDGRHHEERLGWLWRRLHPTQLSVDARAANAVRAARTVRFSIWSTCILGYERGTTLPGGGTDDRRQRDGQWR